MCTLKHPTHCLPGRNEKLEKNNYPPWHLPETPTVNGEPTLLLAEIPKGQASLAENIISGSDEVIFFWAVQ